MAGVKQAQNYFASVVGLARDRGLIGSVLRTYPDWVWQAADKWAEQDADYQTNYNDPNRLPLPDPWRFLLDLRDVSEMDKGVFRAAQSQLLAFRHLNRIRMGTATLTTDWHREAIRARKTGDEARSNHAANKVANGLWPFVKVSEILREYAKDRPELLNSARVWQERRRKELVRHGALEDFQKPKQWPSHREFRDQNKLAVFLVEWWVRQGINGAPGFMFWRNEPMVEFLQLRFKRTSTDLSPAEIKKVRQRLGLIPASKNNHAIWSIRIEHDSKENRTIEGLQRNGALGFKSKVPPFKI